MSRQSREGFGGAIRICVVGFAPAKLKLRRGVSRAQGRVNVR